MALNEYQREIIAEAYKTFRDFENKEPDIVNRANTILQELNQDIMNWDEEADISFIFAEDNGKYLIGSGPDCIASPKKAKSSGKNFIRFLEDEKTQGIIKEMFKIRKKEKMDFRIPAKIYKLGLFDYLKEYKFKGEKPWFYTLRFVGMIYPEIFTTIAERKQLFKTAKILQFDDVRDDKKNYRFELVQLQIRYKIKEYLEENDLINNESLWSRASIATNITDVYKRA